MDEPPRLTDLGVKVFLSQTLKKCHSYRENYYNIVINLIILFCFFAIIGIILKINKNGFIVKTKDNFIRVTEFEFNGKIKVGDRFDIK